MEERPLAMAAAAAAALLLCALRHRLALRDSSDRSPAPEQPKQLKKVLSTSFKHTADDDAFLLLATPAANGASPAKVRSLRRNFSAANNESSAVTVGATRNRVAFELRTFRGSDAKPEVHPASRGCITTELASKSKVEFRWMDPPKMVLLLKRPNDSDATEAFKIAIRIFWAHQVTVLLQDDTRGDLPEPVSTDFVQFSSFQDLQMNPVDIIVVFGGDGSLIYASKAFPGGCPPIIAFAMGSLGFLTPFSAASIPSTLDWLLTQRSFGLRLRSRIQFSVFREGTLIASIPVLNEGVIGGTEASSPSLTKLVIFTHPSSDLEVTTFQGDGLIISTPTGSTAYSLSAGGSMVHPNVPAILVTPIAPFSLSFRPVILADYTCLKIQVAPDARAPARISFDGGQSIRLYPGDFVVCTTSQHPIPTVVHGTRDGDDSWLLSLRTALHWNQAQVPQRPLQV